MALSERQKDVIRQAMANKDEGEAIIAEIDKIAAVGAIAPLGSTSNLTALAPAASAITSSAGTYSIGADPTGTEVDTAIDEATAKLDTALDLKADNVDAETLRTEVEARIDAIEAKVDAMIAAQG